MVLAALAILWIVVLGSYAKERFGNRRNDSVSAFRVQLSTLERTQVGGSPLRPTSRPTGSAPPQSRSEVARIRRRNILLGLLTAAMVGFILLVGAPSAVTALLFVTSAAALAGYVALLVSQQRIVAEQRAKVRRIHPAHRRPVGGSRPLVGVVGRSELG